MQSDKLQISARQNAAAKYPYSGVGWSGLAKNSCAVHQL
jgi:hypothetical protein